MSQVMPIQVQLVSTAEPDCRDGSMMRYGQLVRRALAEFAADQVVVRETSLAPRQAFLSLLPPVLRTPVRYLIIAARAHRLLRARTGAIVHLLDGSHAYAFKGLRPEDTPLVVTVHDLIPALRVRGRFGPVKSGRCGSLVVRCALDGLARASAIAADSASTSRDLLDVVGLPPDIVRVVPLAVQMPPAFAARTDEPVPEPYLLHVAGNNTFYKNRCGVIDIFTEVRRGTDVGLKMAGAPPDKALTAKVAASGCADAIEFLSNVPEDRLAQLYRQAALLVFPSLYEGFGWPPLEAMSHGCPVVCSNVASLPEVVGDAALLAAPADVAAMARHCLNVLGDASLRRRLSDAGRRNVRRFTLDRMASGLMETYRCALERFQRARHGHAHSG